MCLFQIPPKVKPYHNREMYPQSHLQTGQNHKYYRWVAANHDAANG